MSSELRHQASLALNFVLAVTVVGLALYKLARASAPSAIEAGPGKTTNEISPRKMANETPVFTQQPKLPRYADIESASDRRRAIIDQLRAMGVPNDVLALVAREDFEVQWDSRFEKCHGDPDKMAAVQLEKDMSKDAEMRAALGEEGFKQWDQKNMLWEAMSTEVEVTASEAAAIYDLKKKLQQRQFDVEQAGLKGTMDDAEINEAYDKAYSEYNQQLKAVLGDDRYAKSQQTDDAFTSDLLRHELAKANPSDSQFQELFKAQQEWNKSLSELDPASPDYPEKFKALNEARDQEYQRVLGTDVFDTLQKQQDSGYSQMKKYETLWGLDDSKIDYVYGTMKQYAKSVQDYRAQVSALQAQGQNVDWDVVNQKLQQLAGQTQQALQNHLGQDSFNKLQRNRVLKFAGVRPPQ
jgi:hypothetical protein